MDDQPLVKICGLRRKEDILIADKLGADFLGFILSPGFSRSLDLDEVRSVIKSVRSVKVAVLVNEDPENSIAAAEEIGATIMQLHGDEPTSTIEELRNRGDWLIWKGIRVKSADDVSRAIDTWGSLVDGFLLEGWKEGVIGGGGLKLEVDPVVLLNLIPSETQFILAGGLTPENVAEAAVRFQPNILDVSSGVELVHGCKDTERMRRFIELSRVSQKLDSGVTAFTTHGDILSDH